MSALIGNASIITKVFFFTLALRSFAVFDIQNGIKYSIVGTLTDIVILLTLYNYLPNPKNTGENRVDPEQIGDKVKLAHVAFISALGVIMMLSIELMKSKVLSFILLILIIAATILILLNMQFLVSFLDSRDDNISQRKQNSHEEESSQELESNELELDDNEDGFF